MLLLTLLLVVLEAILALGSVPNGESTLKPPSPGCGQTHTAIDRLTNFTLQSGGQRR